MKRDEHFFLLRVVGPLEEVCCAYYLQSVLFASLWQRRHSLLAQTFVTKLGHDKAKGRLLQFSGASALVSRNLLALYNVRASQLSKAISFVRSYAVDIMCRYSGHQNDPVDKGKVLVVLKV